MEQWLYTKGSDGFTVMFPYLPGGLEDDQGRQDCENLSHGELG